MYHLLDVPIIVAGQGEYEVRVKITLHTKTGTLTRSRSFGIASEDGVVWFGRDAVDHAIEEKIRHQVESDNSVSIENKEKEFQRRLQEQEQLRSKISRANAGLSMDDADALRRSPLAAGDILTLNASWVGKGTGKLGTNNGDTNFLMHGVKVTDKDKGPAPLSSDINGYIVDGVFSFSAPRDGYSYKVIMETVFPGINADGSIRTTGNGIGSFSLVKQTSAGSIYTCEAEDSLSVVCSQAQTGSKTSSSAWAAFHGVVEMIVQAKIDLYNTLLTKKYGATVVNLLLTGENSINVVGLRGALDLASTFAEFGVAPYLETPVPKTKVDLLKDKSGPKFGWSQKKTGTLKGLTTFTLAFYTFDLKTLVFSKTGITAKEYTLTENDIKNVKSGVDGLSSNPSSLYAVIIGQNSETPNSGPYLSNPVELMIKNVDRTVVVVVDSSGSNTSTDPSNLRVVAAKETLKSLESKAEAARNNSVPDLAGAIDFDSGVTILSSLADPDSVIPTLNAIDSSGGTDIAGGINSAVQILEDLNTAGISGIIEDKASIIVFTDGENNAGPLPVIQAIVNATLKGIRVHLGFLMPNISHSLVIPSDVPPGYVVPDFPDAWSNATTSPATIEEAILASGGVYALIGDPESQVAFVKQIKNRGISNSDNSDPGGQRVVGQTETFDSLDNPYGTRDFQFEGAYLENVTIYVDTNNNFHPVLKVIDRDGNIIAIDIDSDNDGVIGLNFTLPYAGIYHAEVASKDGNTGIFSIFVDVRNVLTSGFPWNMLISALVANPQEESPPVWGVDNHVCCSIGSYTFSLTSGGNT